MAQNKPRTITQISVGNHGKVFVVAALCDDSSVWISVDAGVWQPFQPIPQHEIPKLDTSTRPGKDPKK